jgi:dTDP-4-amino-4,6-dideoxygalactose transaminase
MLNSKLKVSFGTINITEKSKELIIESLSKGRISSGKLVHEFEKRFAALHGINEAVAVSSGTDAVALALAVLYDYGAERGDEVILPSLSFVATGNAVLHAGFKPVFVDIKRDTLNIDVDKIEQAITDRTIAILPVHLMGKPADMDPIMDIARRHNLQVIEDAAEAHGAYYKGKKIGAIGHMAAFSLYIAHIITTGEGGIILTEDEAKAEIIRSLRSHGRACKCKTCTLNISGGYCDKRFNNEGNTDIRFVFERMGFSSKMNEMEAAIGLGCLDQYEEIIRVRRQNFYSLTDMLSKYSDLFYTIKEEKYERIGPHAFPIILTPEAPFTRDELVLYLENNGIETRNLFQSMPTECMGFRFLGHKRGEFPEAEYVSKHGLHIGVHQDITMQHLYYIDKVIANFIDLMKPSGMLDMN